MKIRPIIFAALLASPVAAQTTPPLLEVNPDPTNSTVEWVTQVVTPWIYNLEMRITAEEGGWVLPALDAFSTHPNAPTWLAEADSTPLEDFTGIQTAFTGQSVRLSEHSFDYCLRLGFRDVFTKQLDPYYVVNWYVPLLKYGGQRVWHSSPPVWLANLGPHAILSRIQWESLNSEFINNQSYQRPTIFSTESLFRYALLLRALTSAQPSSEVDRYLESPAFDDALYNATVEDLGFKIQGIWLMTTTPNTQPGTTPQTAPRLSLPPFAAVTNSVTIPLCLPPPSTTSFRANGLLGTFSPGETRYFSLTNTVPPVRVVFPTTNGPQTVIAHSEIAWWNPIRYRVTVPANVTEGDISASDVRQFTPIQIGQVTTVPPLP